MSISARFNKWLAQHMFYVVLSGLVLGLTSPLPPTPLLNKIAIALFAYMTFVTSLDTSYKSFIHVLTRPWLTFWMLLLLHGGLPVIALVLGLLVFPQSEFTRLGLFIGASIPIGVTSVIWTSIAKGDVPQALVAVTADTLLSPFLLPALIFMVAGKIVHINYGQMLVGLLLMVTIPSFLGMGVNTLARGRLTEFTRSTGGCTSKLSLFAVILINANAVAPAIEWTPSLLKLVLTILTISICGFLLGYAGTFILKERRRDTVATMVYNVGMRNIAFGSVLAVTYFPAAVAIPVTLATLFQQPLSAVVLHLFNRYDRRKLQSE